MAAVPMAEEDLLRRFLPFFRCFCARFRLMYRSSTSFAFGPDSSVSSSFRVVAEAAALSSRSTVALFRPMSARSCSVYCRRSAQISSFSSAATGRGAQFGPTKPYCHKQAAPAASAQALLRGWDVQCGGVQGGLLSPCVAAP